MNQKDCSGKTLKLPDRIPAAAGIVNLRYKSCPEMAGQDQFQNWQGYFLIYLKAVLRYTLSL